MNRVDSLQTEVIWWQSGGVKESARFYVALAVTGLKDCHWGVSSVAG